MPVMRSVLSTVLVTGSLMLIAGSGSAAPSGSLFDIAAVIEQVKRELAAVQELNSDAQPLRVDEAQLQLDLIETPSAGSRTGAKLMIPSADFAGGKDAGKPVLRQRLTIDVAPNRDTKGGGQGGLSTALGEVRSAVRAAMASSPAFDLKRMTVDIDFIVERDARGQVALVAYAQDRRPQASNVQGIKVKFATKEK